MVASHVNDPPTPSSEELGDPLGCLKSTSETKQIAVIAISLLCWGATWQLGVINGLTFVAGNVLTIVGVYFVLLNFFGDATYVCEYGLELQSNGRRNAFRFEAITSVAAKHKHHYMQRNFVRTYVGSKAELSFELENRFTTFTFTCDYRRNDSKEKLIDLILQQSSEAVQHRLLAILKSEGELAWTNHVFLTENGVKIVDATDVSRLVPFTDIEDMKMQDNQLKIWKRGDSLPFMVLSNEATNFVPLLGLFRRLTTCSHDLDLNDDDSLVSGIGVSRSSNWE